MKGCEKYKGLIMGLIDQELTPEETSELNDHLVKCADCRVEYEQLRDTGSKIETISFEEPQDAVLKKLWKSPYSRLAKVSGLAMVIIGWLVLVVYGVIEMLKDNSEPFFPKVAVVAVFLGFFILLIYVIRGRMKTYKMDPYKEVKR